jgi:predicted transcriptional regulator of viral defense system
MAAHEGDAAARLPSSFRYTDARQLSISDHVLRELVRTERIERIARGVYRCTDADLANEDLIEIAIKMPEATLCLTTALGRHELSDEPESEVHIALPRDAWCASVRAPVRYHSFARATFDIGRELLPLDDSTSIGIYSAERSIIDAVRLRHREGSDQAYEALGRWLRNGGRPSSLLNMARAFPSVNRHLLLCLQILFGTG